MRLWRKKKSLIPAAAMSIAASMTLILIFLVINASANEEYADYGGPNSDGESDPDAAHLYLSTAGGYPGLRVVPSPLVAAPRTPLQTLLTQAKTQTGAQEKQDYYYPVAAATDPYTNIGYDPYAQSLSKYELFSHPSVVITTVALGGLILGGAATIIAAADRKALRLTINRNENTLNRVTSRTNSGCSAVNGIALVAAAPAGASTAQLAATVNSIISAANGNRCS